MERREKVAHLVNKLVAIQFDKQSFDAQAAVNSLAEKLKAVRLSDDNKRLLRDSAIGAGIGGTVGVLGGGKDRRMSGLLRGATAGAAMGGGYNLLAKGLRGGTPVAAAEPPDLDPLVPLSSDMIPGSGVLGAAWERPITSTLLAGWGAKELSDFADARMTGSYGNRTAPTKAISNYLGSKLKGTPVAAYWDSIKASPTGVQVGSYLDKLKKTPQEQTAALNRKLQQNMTSWSASTVDMPGEETRKAFSEFASRPDNFHSLKQLAANAVDGDPLAARNYDQALSDAVRGLSDDAKKVVSTTSAAQMDRYLNRRPRLVGTSRMRNLGTVALAAGLEPLLWWGGSQIAGRDRGDQYLDRETIKRINEQYPLGQ